MGDEAEDKQQQGGKQPKSAKDALGTVQKQLKDARRKAFENDLKKKVEELNAAESVFLKKQSEVEEFVEQHQHLYA